MYTNNQSNAIPQEERELTVTNLPNGCNKTLTRIGQNALDHEMLSEEREIIGRNLWRHGQGKWTWRSKNSNWIGILSKKDGWLGEKQQNWDIEQRR